MHAWVSLLYFWHLKSWPCQFSPVSIHISLQSQLPQQRCCKEIPWHLNKECPLTTIYIWERNVLFNDALNTFYLRLYGVRHMVKDHSDSQKGNRCRHNGYSYRLTARVLLYVPSHRQDSTYHGLWYISRDTLAGTKNSSMGPPHEGSIRRHIAPWPNALITELHLAPCLLKWGSHACLAFARIFLASEIVTVPVFPCLHTHLLTVPPTPNNEAIAKWCCKEMPWHLDKECLLTTINIWIQESLFKLLACTMT